jgi:hypothetical protein
MNFFATKELPPMEALIMSVVAPNKNSAALAIAINLARQRCPMEEIVHRSELSETTV